MLPIKSENELPPVPLGSLFRIAWFDELFPDAYEQATNDGWTSQGVTALVDAEYINPYMRMAEVPLEWFANAPHGTKGLLLVDWGHDVYKGLQTTWYGLLLKEQVIWIRSTDLVLERTAEYGVP